MGRRAWGVQIAICFAVLTLMAAMGLTPASGSAPHAGTIADPSLLAATVFPLALDVVPAKTASGFDPLVMRTPSSPELLAAYTATPVTPAPPASPASNDPCAPNRPLTAPVFIKNGPKDKPRVAVTIDDTFGASGAKNVAAALDLAKAKNARLTFFPTGGALDDHDKAGLIGVWRRVLAEGHEIGNHTYTHWNLLKLGEKDIQDELDSMQARLDQALGFHYEIHLMRPPGGNGGYPSSRPDPNGDRVRCVVQRLGYSMTMWTHDSNGTSGFNDYLNRLLAPGVVGNGSVILLHFTTFSVANLSSLIDGLQRRGMELVTVSQLFA